MVKLLNLKVNYRNMPEDKTAFCKKIFEEIKDIYKGYSNEYRASTQPFYLPHTEKYLKDFKYDPNNLIIRESLIEHVGSLPIVASCIFPYLKDNEVNLGHTLAYQYTILES